MSLKTSDPLFAPPSDEEMALAKPQTPQGDMWGAPTKEELAINQPPVPIGPSKLESVMRGAAKGMTFGFADEASAHANAVGQYLSGKLGLTTDLPFSDLYQTNLNAIRHRDAQAAEENPVSFGGGELVGTVLSPASKVLAPAKGAGALAVIGKGALGGAIAGAGDSTAHPFTSPEELENFAGDVGKGAAIAGGFSGILHGIGKAVMPIASKVLGGIDSDTIRRYLARRTQINAAGAEPEYAVKDTIDNAVSGVMTDRDLAAARAAKSEEGLANLMQQKKLELQGVETPLAKAKEMTANVEAQKGYLRSLSEQADDALERGGATFQKDHLLDAIDQIGKGAGDAIGDEAHSALQKLQTTRQRIVEQLPDEISAPKLRQVLKQLRRDIDFDQSAGEFNDTLNGMRKDFTSKISNVLKGQAPGMTPEPWQQEYAGYMGRMSDLSENMSTMNRYFGDEAKALGSLETLRKGSGPRAQVIEDALKNHAAVSGDQTLLQHLGDLRKNQEILRRMKAGEDLSAELFPQQAGQSAEHAADLQMAEEMAQPIDRISKGRTQSLIRNQGGTVPSIEDKRALEALGHASEGQNFQQMIDDRNIFDKFGKGQEKSGRLAIMGSTLGGGIGYAIGHGPGAAIGSAIGGSVGGSLNHYGPQIVKKMVDTGVNVAERSRNVSQGLLGKEGSAILGQTFSPQTMGLETTHHFMAQSPDEAAHDRRQRLRQIMVKRLGDLREQGYQTGP